MRGLWLALSMFTVAPVPSTRVSEANRDTAGQALRWLPLVGAAMGALAGAVSLVFWRGDGRGSPLLAAVTVVTVMAVLSRALHLDGLADVADGLGSRQPPVGALAIMKQSDIGPFGVVSVLFVLLLQVAALDEVFTVLDPVQIVVVTALVVASGRLAAVHGAAVEVPSARPDGFGGLVAGSASATMRGLITVATVAVAIGFGVLVDFGQTGLFALLACFMAGQFFAQLLLRHAIRRFGGVTGDVFGALIEVATTATVLVLAGVVTWHRVL